MVEDCRFGGSVNLSALISDTRDTNQELAFPVVGEGMFQRRAAELYGIGRRTLARRPRLGKTGV